MPWYRWCMYICKTLACRAHGTSPRHVWKIVRPTMMGPKGVITVGPSFEHAYKCDVECVKRAEAQAEDEALAATLDKMASEALDSTHRHTGSFEPAEGIKKVPLDPSHPDGKTLRVSDTLSSK